jgi:hypothetical protein
MLSDVDCSYEAGSGIVFIPIQINLFPKHLIYVNPWVEFIWLLQPESAGYPAQIQPCTPALVSSALML